MYIVKSPILLVIFNRPEHTNKIFNKIREAKPAKLYIAADGPRLNNADDIKKCQDVKKNVERIDWVCEVFKLYRNTNLGCKLAVSESITWFFENEEEGIIIEDDCLPCESFFYFCDEMLKRYRNDSRIHNITGTNLQNGQLRGDSSYFFSQYSNIWGWASWRRVWIKYDAQLKNYREGEIYHQLYQVFNNKALVEEWFLIFKDIKSNKIDTWDYQFNFITFFENALCIVPNINLISNIGHGPDATHTLDPNNHNANLPTGEIFHLTHPRYFLPDKEADYYFLKKELCPED